MKIGLVSPYDLSRPGGVQAQVLGLARTLDAIGDVVKVIGPGLPDGIDGVDLGPTATVPGNRSRVPISLDPRLSKVLSVVTRDIDVLHVHEPLMPVVSLAALRAGPPVVATFHADPGRAVRMAYSASAALLRRLLGDNVRVVSAVSETAASALPAGFELEVVPNGVDTSALRVPAARDPRLVVFLGRDEPRKGLDVLLEAWPSISQAVPEAHLTVLGCDRGSGQATWLRDVTDTTKANVLNQAAVLVAPNTGGESFGIVLIEGMAAGAAVVASDLEAFIDVGGDAARYFPVRDSAALAETVLEVLENDKLRQAMSSRGIERAAQYDWGIVATRYRELYTTAIS